MDKASVKLLDLVSEPLRAELHFELHAPELAEHPFLRRYCELHPEVMSKVCHGALSLKQMSSGDAIFNQGELPAEPQMLFVLAGAIANLRKSISFPCNAWLKRPSTGAFKCSSIRLGGTC